MPKTKTANPQAVLVSWDDVDSALAALCGIQQRRATLEADMNAKIDSIKRHYLPQLEDLAQNGALDLRLIEAFAREHKPDFTPQKSIERLHGTLSFRTSPPAVKPLNRKWTAQRILESVAGVLGTQFTRVERSLAKDVLLAERANGDLTDQQLAQVGLKIVQEETFSVELKRESTPDAQRA